MLGDQQFEELQQIKEKIYCNKWGNI